MKRPTDSSVGAVRTNNLVHEQTIWPALQWTGAIALKVLAVLAVLMSATINWRFGFHQLGGNDLWQSHTIAAILVVVDLFKAILPIIVDLIPARSSFRGQVNSPRSSGT